MSSSRALAIFGSSATEPGSPHWVDAELAGKRCAEAGFAVVTGGYGGTMEAASRGAGLAGGEVIGVTAPSLFAERSGANAHVTHEIVTESLTERIGLLTSLASGAIVLPGSIARRPSSSLHGTSITSGAATGGGGFRPSRSGPAGCSSARCSPGRLGHSPATSTPLTPRLPGSTGCWHSPRPNRVTRALFAPGHHLICRP